jgi:hypothetical protein
MTTNDDLDDFFKKKDRKANKHKKQTGLLTNNEELHKQLVSVTTATLAFKEHMEFDDEDDEHQPNNNDDIVGTTHTEDTHKNPTSHKKKYPDENKTINNGQQLNLTEQTAGQPQQQQQQQQQQQDEWEDYTDPNSKYEQLRLKFTHGNNDDNNDDEYYDDDENNPNNNNDNNERNIDREQIKDKPVWNINQIKQQQIETNIEEKIEESTPIPQAKPSVSVGAYRPPQLRGSSSGGTGSITVVSGVSQRSTKKEKPNIASTDEFPTLGSAVHKK